VRGIVTGRGPRVQALFSIKSLAVNRLLWFTVDSGSSFSAISEADAILAGIDCSTLPFAKVETIGFGGFFKPRMINTHLELTFVTDEGEYRLLRSGFMVVCPPDNLEEKLRKRMIEVTPSVLGMDVLSKFDVHIYKKRVELEVRGG
jgi:hypothetical protein